LPSLVVFRRRKRRRRISILSSASPLYFLLLSIHIFLTFHLLPSPSFTIPLFESCYPHCRYNGTFRQK
jgi:hypothetical protein